jgi:hypothetical protein
VLACLLGAASPLNSGTRIGIDYGPTPWADCGFYFIALSGLWKLIAALFLSCGCFAAPSSRLALSSPSLGLSEKAVDLSWGIDDQGGFRFWGGRLISFFNVRK